MIEITINDLINSGDIFRDLAQQPIKMRVAYNIARIIREIENEMKLFEETRRKLFDKYGEKDENGELLINADGNITITPENISLYNNEIQEVLNTSITLNAEKLNIEDLENIELTPNQVYLINAFINE